MKKYLFPILTSFMLVSLILSSCKAGTTAKLKDGQSFSTVSNNPNAFIINNVSKDYINKYSDLNITNEWVGDKCSEYRYVVLFGALKSDLKQGVAEVIRYNPNCTQIIIKKIFLDTLEQGYVKVISLGSKDDNMEICDSVGNKRTFSYNLGFDPKE